MQDTMVYEQEQLLFAIDDIDDATIMAESAVIHQIANLWLKTSMIQESMTPEQFEKYYQEANAAERIGGKMDDFAAKVKDKIHNFSFKELLGKIWDAIKRIWSVMWGKFKKFIAHFKPSYISHLVRTKSSVLAKVAKEYGCKVKAETDGSITLLLPFIDLDRFKTWIKRNESNVDRMIKDLEKAVNGERNITKMRKVKYFDTIDVLGIDDLQGRLASFSQQCGLNKPEDINATRFNAQVARDFVKIFPTKLMSAEEFEDRNISGEGKIKTISGKPKAFQNLTQYFNEFAAKVDKMCGLAKQFDSKVQGNADSSADLKAFATSLVDESNKFLGNVTTAQQALSTALNVSKALCETIDTAVRNMEGTASDKYVEKLNKQVGKGNVEGAAASAINQVEVLNRANGNTPA